MNRSRHTFSTESYPDLKEFLNLVSQQNVDNSEKINFWKKILPKNEDLVVNISKHDSNDAIEIIDLCDEPVNSQENALLQSVDYIETTNNFELDDLMIVDEDHIVIEDIAVKIQQQLISEDGLSTKMIKNLIEECNTQKLHELFSHLGESLDNELIYSLGYSILRCECVEANRIASFYCQFLLIKKLHEEDSVTTTSIFNDFLNVLPHIVCPEVSKSLINIQEECPVALQEILNNLKVDDKQKILKEFILNCTKIYCGHFLILDSLLAGDLDLGVIKKLIELLVSSANQFQTNKAFGKLLFSVIQKIGKHVQYFTEELRVIIANHKTAWHRKAMEALEECNKEQQSINFSQTLHF